MEDKLLWYVVVSHGAVIDVTTSKRIVDEIYNNLSSTLFLTTITLELTLDQANALTLARSRKIGGSLLWQ